MHFSRKLLFQNLVHLQVMPSHKNLPSSKGFSFPSQTAKQQVILIEIAVKYILHYIDEMLSQNLLTYFSISK